MLYCFSDKNTTVYIGVNVNRVSGVDENKEVSEQFAWKENFKNSNTV